jgi:peptidoglycan/LPS O-acetylase OafA/YrhL
VSEPSAQRLGHLPALDGLRGLAILLVVAVHTTGYPPGGHLGVDLFFVLSGFLITTLLLEERSATGRISLKSFYARRAQRLLPALALMLVAYLLIDAFKRHDGLRTAALAGLYFGNFVQAFTNGSLYHTGLEHLWTLAEEEQFYLLWPLALPFVARSGRPVRFLGVLIASLIAYRISLALGGAGHTRLYEGPDTHGEGLVAGSAVAFARVKWPRLTVPWQLAALGLLALLPLLWRRPSVSGDIVLPVAEAAWVALLIAALTIPAWRQAFSWRLLRWFGRISYSLYLWHYMLMWAFDWKLNPIASLLAVAVAYASTRWFEQPLRRRRKRVRDLIAGLPPAASSVAPEAG